MLKKIIFLILLNIIFQNTCIAVNEVQLPENKSLLLVISCSLNPESHSAIIAKQAYDFLKSKGQDVSFLDLRKYNLPIANGHDQSAYADPQIKEIHDRILHAKGIIIASPIYNYSIAATTKNLFELTSHPYKQILSGTAWKDKVIGFIGAAGSPNSMLAFFPFLNSLMMDSKAIIVPHFVFATQDDFKGGEPAQEIKQRTMELATEMSRITQALSSK